MAHFPALAVFILSALLPALIFLTDFDISRYLFAFKLITSMIFKPESCGSLSSLVPFLGTPATGPFVATNINYAS